MSDIFDDDELSVVTRADCKTWNQDQILGYPGLFFAKDIQGVLKLDIVKIRSHLKQIIARGDNPWLVMGVRKQFSKWVIRMTVFAPYYREHLVPKWRPVDTGWNGNQLLAQTGLFRLTDVCRLIPFTAHQMRYQANISPNARETIGVFRDPDAGTFLVDMAVFSEWVRRNWK
ncbi:hypothetical protein SCOR_10065 [Sulfidibacter corallicola]|uniref:Uncharacterized protein n=1 Tax=Sulfidibacter corallicola TaxID=2818388 RepID=A0A8A4TPR2_SULCO|nr:hypothetical protein [Sulfidibacter corallicola]QTD50901.1 hypothetical protein J3U87_00400 [Sulfidibacter corallicola]